MIEISARFAALVDVFSADLLFGLSLGCAVGHVLEWVDGIRNWVELRIIVNHAVLGEEIAHDMTPVLCWVCRKKMGSQSFVELPVPDGARRRSYSGRLLQVAR